MALWPHLSPILLVLPLLFATPSFSGEKLDLSPYFGVLSEPGDFKVFSLSMGGQRTVTTLEIQPWSKGWAGHYESTITGAGADYDGRSVFEEFLIPGRQLLSGRETLGGGVLFYPPKPAKALRLLATPGKAQRLKVKAALVLNGRQIGIAERRGSWVDDGYETVATPSGSYPEALRARAFSGLGLDGRLRLVRPSLGSDALVCGRTGARTQGGVPRVLRERLADLDRLVGRGAGLGEPRRRSLPLVLLAVSLCLGFTRSEERAPCAHRDPLRQAVLRRPARAHRVLVRRLGPGHARHAARCVRLRAGAIDRDPAVRRGRPAAAPRAAPPAARLHARLRSRRAARRDAHLRDAGRARPRLVRVLAEPQVPAARLRPRELRVLVAHAAPLPPVRRGRRALPRAGGARLARDPGRRRGGLRPQRRLPLHELRRLRVERHARRQQPPPQRRVPERRRARAPRELHRGHHARGALDARSSGTASRRATAATCSPSRTTRT